MKWLTEHYKLVVTPRYIRTDKSTEIVACSSCDGRGIDYDDREERPYSFCETVKSCRKCLGSGKLEVLAKIPPPPEIDEKFLSDLQNYINNYGERE